MANNTEKQLLSKRELEVLQTLAKGLSNQEIAEELFISVNTVRVHLRNMYEKLEVQSRTEATMRGIQEGLITPPSQNDNSEADEPDIEVEVDTPSTEFTQIIKPYAPVSKLTIQQRIYFSVAVILALMVFATPTIKPFIITPPVTLPLSGCDTISVTLIKTRWECQSQMPTARSHLALAAYNKQLYLIGGYRSSGLTGLVEVFDLATENWQEVASKPTLTANIQAVVIKDNIYVPGGCTGNLEASDLSELEATNQLEIFNPENNTWHTAAPLPEARCAYAATAYKDELYVIGGWNGKDYVNTVYIYNPQSDLWRLLAQAYPAKVGYAAATVFNNTIYVAGGYDNHQEYATVYRLDDEEMWQEETALNYPRGGLGLIAIDKTLYAIGGGWTAPIESNEYYTIDNPTWQTFANPYPGQWRNFGIVSVGSNIFTAGGWTDKYINLVILYSTQFQVFIPITQ